MAEKKKKILKVSWGIWLQASLSRGWESISFQEINCPIGSSYLGLDLTVRHQLSGRAWKILCDPAFALPTHFLEPTPLFWCLFWWSWTTVPSISPFELMSSFLFFSSSSWSVLIVAFVTCFHLVVKAAYKTALLPCLSQNWRNLSLVVQ